MVKTSSYQRRKEYIKKLEKELAFFRPRAQKYEWLYVPLCGSIANKYLSLKELEAIGFPGEADALIDAMTADVGCRRNFFEEVVDMDSDSVFKKTGEQGT